MAKKRSTSIKALVVLCSCNNSIGKTIDLDRLESTLKEYPEVVGVVKTDVMCNSDGYKLLSDQIAATGADRVVLAGCTPRTHEDIFAPLFDGTLGESPISQNMTEHVGIREQVEWVHSDRGAATNKALWLISGALGKLTAPVDLLETDDSQLVFNKDIAVIGGGVAGLATALDLAEAGLKVTIIEKQPEIGGRAFTLHLDDDDKKLLPDINRIKEHENITVRTESEVSVIQGGLGHYKLDLKNGEPVAAGAIVVATGSEVFDADRIAEYRYHLPEVINSYDLSQLLARQGEGLTIKGDSEYTPKNIHFIQCVGSRDENYNPYCTLICCTIGVKQALELKQRLPDANVYIHYMDMRGPYPGFEEKFIEAQDAGVTFSRGRIGDILPAETAEDGHRLDLRGESVELGEVFSWPADLVVLSVGHQPTEGANDLANMTFFPKDRDSFNVEHNYHIDLKDRRGIVFVGTAQGPRFMHHSLADARRGAYEIAEFFGATILSRDVRSIIDEARCTGCGTCVELCPYEAITLSSVFDYDRNVAKRLAVVDINQCQGCGACASGCPSSVPTLQKYSVEQLWRQIEEMI